MKELVSQILDFYTRKMQAPKLEELTSIAKDLETTAGCACITLYLDGDVRGSAGNIKEIKKTLAEEIIESTMSALTGDSRFPPLKLEELEKLQFRVDTISSREMLHLKDIQKIDPAKFGAIAIARDYKSLAFVLPNISPKLMTGDDISEALKQKLSTKELSDKECIFYKITTKSETSF